MKSKTLTSVIVQQLNKDGTGICAGVYDMGKTVGFGRFQWGDDMPFKTLAAVHELQALLKEHPQFSEDVLSGVEIKIGVENAKEMADDLASFVHELRRRYPVRNQGQAIPNIGAG